jgi:hypothetical protein
MKIQDVDRVDQISSRSNCLFVVGLKTIPVVFGYIVHPGHLRSEFQHVDIAENKSPRHYLRNYEQSWATYRIRQKPT